MVKILIAEDNILIHTQISRGLKFEGFECFIAENGLKCLELLKEVSPDLILCDIAMPILDGFQVLENLKKDPLTSSIPFIFLTADASEESIQKAKEMGVSDYITKPFSFEDLLESIKRLI